MRIVWPFIGLPGSEKSLGSDGSGPTLLKDAIEFRVLFQSATMTLRRTEASIKERAVSRPEWDHSPEAAELIASVREQLTVLQTVVRASDVKQLFDGSLDRDDTIQRVSGIVECTGNAFAEAIDTASSYVLAEAQAACAELRTEIKVFFDSVAVSLHALQI